jgi:hypothetical protein
MGIAYYIDREDGVRLNLWKFGYVHDWCDVQSLIWIDSSEINFRPQALLDYWNETPQSIRAKDGGKILDSIELFCRGFKVRFLNDTGCSDEDCHIACGMAEAFYGKNDAGLDKWGIASLSFPPEVYETDIAPYVGVVDRIHFGGLTVRGDIERMLGEVQK